MTTATYSEGPTVGSIVLSTLGRASIWTLTKIISAPLAAGLMGAMAVGTVMAMSNALYFQVIEHPAPMFADETITAAVSPVETPVIETPRQVLPVVQPEPVPLPNAVAAPVEAPTPIVAPVPATPKAVSEITNADIKALQQKLTDMGLYSGKADGFYGPKTAEAIRAFETKIGVNPIGAVTPSVLKAAAGAEVASAPVAREPAPIVPLVPVVETPVQQPTNVAEAAQQVVEVLTPISEQATDPLARIVQRVTTATRDASSAPIPVQNRQVIERVQRGLASLGFLRGEIDGVAGEGTAKAIRNFEVYYNYEVTGAVTPELIDLLTNAGAQI